MDTLSRDRHPFYARLPAIILGFVALLMLIVLSVSVYSLDGAAKAQASERQVLYTAWSKVHPDVRLTYDEWMALHRANLLPR